MFSPKVAQAGKLVVAAISIGLTAQQIYIRSRWRCVRVGMKSLKRGCFTTTTTRNSVVYSTIGYVERPPQVYDALFKPSSNSPFPSRPYFIWAPSGTGKSEYGRKKLEERGCSFMHVLYKGVGNPVGEALGIHGCHGWQFDNSFEILEKALKNLKKDKKIPRCLILVEDPKEENWNDIEMLHEWNKRGLCDLVVVFSERKDVRGILEKVSGKQGRPIKAEYLPPRKETFDEAIKNTCEAGGSLFPFKEDDMMKMLDFVEVNFSDYDRGMEYLQSGLSIEDTFAKLTEDFRADIGEAVYAGVMKRIDLEDLYNSLIVMQTDGKLTTKTGKGGVIGHYLEENVYYKTKNNHFVPQTKAKEIGINAYVCKLLEGKESDDF